jgi:3-phenylpropionate/trans-cinnamate dioxygenase ferredoxin subunit
MKSSPCSVEGADASFFDVAAVDQIPAGRGLVVTVQERSIALFRIGETVHAIDDSCPHAGSSLAAGRLDGCLVRCPSHGLTFDVRDGCIPRIAGFRVAVHAVRIEGDRVCVALSESAR